METVKHAPREQVDHPRKESCRVEANRGSPDSFVVSEALPAPSKLRSQYPLSVAAKESVALAASRVLERLEHGGGGPLAIVGPCSIHCETSALEYAERLVGLQKRIGDRVQVVMRVYFEKPRTVVGWKGFLYDPDLDGSDNLTRGLWRARELLVRIAEMGLPIASEILDPIAAAYLADCLSWAAVGARTAESQIHRQMASGLGCPVGFKNATDGNVEIAVQAIRAARAPHTRLGIDEEGRAAMQRTRGNPGGHVVLRGGASGPNYDEVSVSRARQIMAHAELSAGIVVDCSHGNSRKSFRRQPDVARRVMEQMSRGAPCVAGLMLESHLNSGAQGLCPSPGAREKLDYGVSVTDGCIDFSTTEGLLFELAACS